MPPLWVWMVLSVVTSGPAGAGLQRRPLVRDTDLGRDGDPRAVILVPDEAEYQALGRQLADAIAARAGVRLPVESAAGYVHERPRAVEPDKLDRHFILLGQFWNNAVLERLYCGYFDPTDALYPGAGGYELRTVCAPFRHGHNCVVVTGSDLEGCRKAVQALIELVESTETGSHLPFLHRVHLTGEAAEVEAQYRRNVAPRLAELDRYTTFGQPGGKIWTSWEDPRDFLPWKDRNLAVAACFGLRYWCAAHPDDADAFKRLVFACSQHLDRMAQCYREGRGDLIEYSMGQLLIVWDLIEETDAFSDAERIAITDFLFEVARLGSPQYFAYKCKDLPLDDVQFYNRHQIAGTLWLGRHGEYLTRNCVLTDEQQQLADDWQAHARQYLRRLVQSYFYADGTELLDNEGSLVLRYALMAGDLTQADNGSLRALADYWVANHSNLGEMASSGHCGATRHGPVGGEVLNVAGWLFPGEGYQWYRRRLGRWPYAPFLFHAAPWIGQGFHFHNFELPPNDEGAAELTERMTGVTVLPIGAAFDAYLRRNPDRWQGGYQRTPGRYRYDAIPYEQTFKRIVLRSGVAPGDQYLVLDGMQGIEWSYDDLNAVVRYDDLGQRLLKPQWETRTPESRLELNTLFASNGVPGAKQSVTSRLLRAADLGPHALLSIQALNHDGVAWTRHVFWRKGEWFLFADEVQPHTEGDYFLAQTWLSRSPFSVEGTRATAEVNDVSLHVVGTPERTLGAMEEGVRQKMSARLVSDQPLITWTLLHASNSQREAKWELRRLGPTAASVVDARGDRTALAFVGAVEIASLRARADLGLLSAERMTLVGCRNLSANGRTLISPDKGETFGWNTEEGSFESGKRGFGLTPGTVPDQLRNQREAVAGAVREALAAAARLPQDMPPQVRTRGASQVPDLPVAERLTLPSPVSLAAADLDGDGNDELLLYDSRWKPRFGDTSLRAEPVAVDLDGNGHPDIALALDNSIAVYHADGTLRWRQDLTNTASALSTGDLDSDGREELGLSLHNYAMVLNHAGERLIDQEVYRYTGIGGAFGDVDGDGQTEFVAVTVSGVNVLDPDQPRRSAGFQSFFGTAPCRVWLHDLDGDSTPEGYVGGGGSDPACYDLRAVKCRWKFDSAAVHPRDAELLDVDGDGLPELVSGGGDGFLYVVGADGKFRFSRSVGAGIVSLATVPHAEGATLLAGLETGEVLLLDRSLQPLGRVKVGEGPVEHLAVLRRNGAATSVMAADETGAAARLESRGR